jgi:8-oxo-dGTP diphosphatase
MADKVTKVGVGVVVVRNNKILLGRRKSKLGHGEWAFPGGGMEWRETIEQTAARELGQETSMRAMKYKQIRVDTEYHPEQDAHYVTICVQALGVFGEPMLMEPDKCYEWAWFDWFDLPVRLFSATESLVRSGFIPEGITRPA